MINRLKSRHFLYLSLGLIIVIVVGNVLHMSKSVSAASRANVLLIIADDLDEASFDQLLAAGKLPNIKNYLVNKGIRFENSFVTHSICCPSRASILTGKYSHNTHIYHVVGSESGTDAWGEHFNNNLATWLDGAGYFTGHIGKTMNTDRKTSWPGYDFWRFIGGYDARPGMYPVVKDTNPQVAYPDVFQTKYIGDETLVFINQFKQNGAQNFFLAVNPHSPHVYVPKWNVSTSTFDTDVIDSTKLSVNDSDPIVTFNTFDHPDPEYEIVQQVIKGSTNNQHTIYARFLDNSGWGPWQNIGNDTTSFAGTGSQPIVGMNSYYHPDIQNLRQHLVRGTPGSYTVYYRDRRADKTWTDWLVAGGANTVFGGTGNLPIKGISFYTLESDDLIQEIVRGTPETGYDLHHRARLNGAWTKWSKEAKMWDLGTGSGEITAHNNRYLGDGILQQSFVRKNTKNNHQTLYYREERTHYVSYPASVLGINDGLSSTEEAQPDIYTTEAEQFSQTAETGSTTLPHFFFSTRVLADGNWVNTQSHQTYPASLYGGQLPAGSLRANNDPDGFVPKSAAFDLPGIGKPTFNNPDCINKPHWVCDYWVDLDAAVIDNQTNLAYLRRQHLDRLESLLSLDVMVGQVFKKLTQENLLDNTLIIFTSDNGYFLGEHRLGNKIAAYEESLRAPLIIRPPGSTSARTNQNTVLNIDWAPTILDYAMLDWSHASYKVDGRSLKPLITTNQTLVTPWRKWFYLEHHYPRDYKIDPAWRWAWGIPDFFGIRTGSEASQTEGSNRLYIETQDDPVVANAKTFYELYDMHADGPYQAVNHYNNQVDTIGSDYAAHQTAYQKLMAKYQNCAGESCRDADVDKLALPSPTPIPVPGDLDHDGDVDFLDQNILKANFNDQNCEINLIGTCVIDIFDYNKLVTNFGS